MKPTFLFFGLVLTWCSAAGQSDWDLKRDKDGIVIFTRSSAASPLKEYRASAKIQSPLSDVYEFLTDLESRPEWVINCMGLDIIDTINGRIRYHTRYDIPWPMEDRDLVVEADLRVSEDFARAHLLTRNVELDYGRKEGVIRMPGYLEEVCLEMADSVTTLFTAEGFADPGGKVPAWIVNMFLVDGIYDSVQKTREGVAGRK